jgi:hypothetical protein
MLDGWKCCYYTLENARDEHTFIDSRRIANGGIGDSAILHGNIEVHADENSLILEVKVSDGKLVRERHGGKNEGPGRYLNPDDVRVSRILPR